MEWSTYLGGGGQRTKGCGSRVKVLLFNFINITIVSVIEPIVELLFDFIALHGIYCCIEDLTVARTLRSYLMSVYVYVFVCLSGSQTLSGSLSWFIPVAVDASLAH